MSKKEKKTRAARDRAEMIKLLTQIVQAIEHQGRVASEERRADRSELLAVMARLAEPGSKV
jgi:hypothetical protein